MSLPHIVHYTAVFTPWYSTPHCCFHYLLQYTTLLFSLPGTVQYTAVSTTWYSTLHCCFHYLIQYTTLLFSLPDTVHYTDVYVQYDVGLGRLAVVKKYGVKIIVYLVQFGKLSYR